MRFLYYEIETHQIEFFAVLNIEKYRVLKKLNEKGHFLWKNFFSQDNQSLCVLLWERQPEPMCVLLWD